MRETFGEAAIAGGDGRQVAWITIAPVGGRPVDAEFLQRALLNLHELRLDLHLPDVVVAIQDVADPLEIAGRLRDDHRRSVVGETCARRPLEVHPRLLQKASQRLRLSPADASARIRGSWREQAV